MAIFFQSLQLSPLTKLSNIENAKVYHLGVYIISLKALLIMKLFKLSIPLLVLLLSVGLSSCNKENNKVQPESTNQIITLSEEMTGDELDQLLISEFGHTNFSYQEKLDFLAERNLSKATEGQASPRAGTDLYVLVAQVFERPSSGVDQYTTQTKISFGLPASNLKARVQVLDNSNVIFAGANANIYLNNININGMIDGQSNNCIFFQGFYKEAEVNLSSSGSTTVDADVFCSTNPPF